MDNQRVDPSGRDPAAVAREIIDANRYMTLATADADGRPWAAPVWYAHQGYTDLFWVSRPEARHSGNLAVRPEVGIVIFDSTVPVGSGQAVYVEALAEELGEAEREQGIAVFSRRSEAQGAARWDLADVTGPAPLRLYRARASAHFVLDANDQRLPVRLA
jgi:nitroimidazol reductase NimA-like FMN-containing flavoprotein (pyridoxamine 5'-phosphate oxidase superfamily)